MHSTAGRLCGGRALRSHQPSSARRRAASLCRSGATATPTVDLDAIYTTELPIPRFIGPIRIAALPGKGRGVLTTERMLPGDLIIATPPLAVIHSAGERPDAEQLIDYILEQPRVRTSRWFEVLYDGSASSAVIVPDLNHHAASAAADTGSLSVSTASASPAVPTAAPAAGSVAGAADGGAGGAARGGPASSSTLPEPYVPLSASGGERRAVPRAARTAPRAAAAALKGKAAGRGSVARSTVAATAAAATAEAEGTGALPTGEVGQEGEGALAPRNVRRVARVCVKNCFGDNHEDLAALACRGAGEEGTAHVGLWPEFSFFNHSCAPNAINLVSKGTMVVRAVAPLGVGQEVTISYLGRPQLMPLAVRRAALQADYGFDCMCERCCVEEDKEAKVQPIMDDLHELVTGGTRSLVTGLRAAQHCLREAEAALLALGLPAGLASAAAAQRSSAVGALHSPPSVDCGASAPTGSPTSSPTSIPPVAQHTARSLADPWPAPLSSPSATFEAATAAAAEVGKARTAVSCAAEEANDAVQAGVQRMYAAFRTAALTPTVRQYLCASLYDAFEVLLDCQQALERDTSATLATCVKAAAAVTSGSDLHVILSARQVVAARLTVTEAIAAAAAAADADPVAPAGGDGTGEGRQDTVKADAVQDAAAALAVAQAAASRAHVARYGRVSAALQERLIHFNATLYD